MAISREQKEVLKLYLFRFRRVLSEFRALIHKEPLPLKAKHKRKKVKKTSKKRSNR